MSEETTPCVCGKKMVMVYTGLTYSSFPGQRQRMWKCFGCGVSLPAPNERIVSPIDLDRQRWERVNAMVEQPMAVVPSSAPHGRCPDCGDPYVTARRGDRLIPKWCTHCDGFG